MSERDLEIETWKDIPDYPGYMASTHGRIKSIGHVSKRGTKYPVKGKIRKCILSKSGYLRIQLTHKGKIHQVHQLIALTFLDNKNKYTSVNHKNGVKTDNRVLNLEWCTSQQNTLHAVRSGLFNPPKGIKHWSSKFDGVQLPTIQSCLSDGVTAYKLAKYFRVSQSVIHNIKHGNTYARPTRVR